MIRDITIKAAMNGFIAEVGCQKLVFENLEGLFTCMRSYYADPPGVERDFCKNALNAKHTLRVTPVIDQVGQERLWDQINREPCVMTGDEVGAPVDNAIWQELAANRLRDRQSHETAAAHIARMNRHEGQVGQDMEGDDWAAPDVLARDSNAG